MQFVVTEAFKLNSYSQKDFKLSHYQTATGQEIDLILSNLKAVSFYNNPINEISRSGSELANETVDFGVDVVP